MEQVSQRLQRHEFVAAEEMLTSCLPESIVQAMNRVEKIEQRVLVGLDAMPVIQPKEPLSGSLTTFHQHTNHVASLNELAVLFCTSGQPSTSNSLDGGFGVRQPRCVEHRL